VKINGSLAYVSQKPWVMCETLENNIYFTFPKDRELLDSALESACLLDDVKILPEGLKTTIGESGINLSGGQKARVALGRAFYSSSDIYLFDDVLSAVDVHVGEFLLR
jgi:ABC-type multidrug transport system fused ATPase/permease subunit